MCILYKDCRRFLFEANDFITNDKNCGSEVSKPGWKLVVVGGEHPEAGDTSRDPVASNSIEVLDLLNPNNVCQPLKNHPLRLQNAYGEKIDDNMPLICGGNSNEYKKRSHSKCFYLGDSDPFYPEPAVNLYEGKSHASTISYENALIVFGGYDYTGYGGKYESYDTIEKIQPGSAENTVGYLPFTFAYGCAVQVGVSVYLIGGEQNEQVTNQTWVGGISRYWDDWTQGVELNTPRKDHGCAVINGVGIIVMGGVDSSDIPWDYLKTVEILTYDQGALSTTEFDYGKN